MTRLAAYWGRFIVCWKPSNWPLWSPEKIRCFDSYWCQTSTFSGIFATPYRWAEYSKTELCISSTQNCSAGCRNACEGRPRVCQEPDDAYNSPLSVVSAIPNNETTISTLTKHATGGMSLNIDKDSIVGFSYHRLDIWIPEYSRILNGFIIYLDQAMERCRKLFEYHNYRSFYKSIITREWWDTSWSAACTTPCYTSCIGPTRCNIYTQHRMIPMTVPTTSPIKWKQITWNASQRVAHSCLSPLKYLAHD